MKILEENKQKIEISTGIWFKDEFDYINYMHNLIEYLADHNKNYTKKQYFKILELKEIINNIIE